MNIKGKLSKVVLTAVIAFSLCASINVQANAVDSKTIASSNANETVNPGKVENKPIAQSISEHKSSGKLGDNNPNITSSIGWKNESGIWYYYKSDNSKATGWIKPDGNWYYLKANGEMATGWLKDGGTWYFFDNSGAMVKGWKQLNNIWYFLDESGAMVTGLNKIDNINYMFNDSGAMATGWIKLNNNYLYYFHNDGSMATGWIVDNGKNYYLYDTGERAKGWININGEWYFLDDNGVRLTGWINSGNDFYYLDPSTGKVLTNTTIDGYTIGSNGKRAAAINSKSTSSNNTTSGTNTKSTTNIEVKTGNFKGVDISNHNGNVDFAKVKAAGIEGVYMKATEGTTYIDPYLEGDYKGAKDAGLKIGFYHFLVGTSLPETQAENFYNNIKNKKSDLKPCLDIEKTGFDIMDYTIRFIDKFKELSNMDVCIYTYSGFMNNLDNRLAKYTLWEANFNNKPFELPSNNIWNSRGGHQYFDKGSIDGIKGNVDLDEFTKDILK